MAKKTNTEVPLTQASMDAKVYNPAKIVPQSQLTELPGIFEGLQEMAQAYEPKPE